MHRKISFLSGNFVLNLSPTFFVYHVVIRVVLVGDDFYFRTAVLERSESLWGSSFPSPTPRWELDLEASYGT